MRKNNQITLKEYKNKKRKVKEMFEEGEDYKSKVCNNQERKIIKK